MELCHRRSARLPASVARELSARSDTAGALRLGAHLTLWLAAAVLTWQALESVWVWPAMALQGLIQTALFAPLHECVHRTAFRHRAPNDWSAAVIGFVHGLPAGYFRRFHFAHHRFTQNPAHDPELATSKPETVPRYLFWISGLRYWCERSGTLLRHAAGRSLPGFVPDTEHPAIVAEARRHLALYLGVVVASLALGRAEAFWLWLGPALLGQPWLRLYLLAEHTGAAVGDDMLTNTRTTRAAIPACWLMWNMPYHAEHHVYPAVPFHRLPALHGLMAPHLRVTATGYGEVHRAYWRALRAGRGAEFTQPPAASSPPPDRAPVPAAA